MYPWAPAWSSLSMLLRNSLRVAGSRLGPISVRTRALDRSAWREYPPPAPISNVMAWFPPHSQGSPRSECRTRLLLLLTPHVLPAWLMLQRFLTWKREVGLTSHTLTLTSQAPERPGCQGSDLPVLLF